jgi:hypothetical protein
MLSNFKLNHKFGDSKDPRNYIYDCIHNNKVNGQNTGTIVNSLHLAPSTSSNIKVTPLCGVLNQGNLGACAPNALSVAISIASNGSINDSCRLYTYFITESLEGANPLQDNGSTTQAIAQSLSNYKCCSEKYFPYISSNYLKIPPITCFQNTYPLKTVIYSYINQDSNLWSNIQNAVLHLFTFQTPIIYKSIFINNYL